MKSDRINLEHILACVAKIETYIQAGQADFFNESMIQDAVMRNLEVIGEAANNVASEFRSAHPEINWRRAIELRNVLIHNYMGVNVARVWSDVTRVLPRLKEQVEALLAELPREQID